VEGDDGFKEFVFMVSRTNASGDTQADWRITGTGITDADFEALTGTVSFTGNQTSQEIRVKVRGDTSFESNETFTITLSNATNGQIVGSSATGRIDNDDPAPAVPTVQFDTANPVVEHAEGAAGTTVTYTYTLTRDSDVGRSVVAWAVTGSGVTAADFGGTVPNGTATFEAGETSTTITVTVSGDAEFEPTEGFVVTLSQAANGNAAIGPNRTATGTITNDDAEPIPQANRAPDNIAPNTFLVQELAGAGTKVGSVSTTDPDGDQLSYELIGNAEGRFKLVGTDLLVDDGFRLDHEQASSHQVTVRVRDTAGHVVDQTLTVGVADWISESTGGSTANDVFKGGRGNDVLSGGLGNDRLFGGIDNDTLRGDAGNDVLGGGEGKDKLYGLKGSGSRDAFLFDTKLTSKSVANKHKDTVYDFGSRFDSIYLDDAAFTNATIARQLKNKGASLDKPFKMKAGFFKVGTKATDRDDFFIYNDRNKKLYWDVDGSGRKAMVEIATFKFQKGEGAAKLAASDFFFV
jgi:Ca2+-binding RTX toxin-like protein